MSVFRIFHGVSVIHPIRKGRGIEIATGRIADETKEGQPRCQDSKKQSFRGQCFPQRSKLLLKTRPVFNDHWHRLNCLSTHSFDTKDRSCDLLLNLRPAESGRVIAADHSVYSGKFNQGNDLNSSPHRERLDSSQTSRPFWLSAKTIFPLLVHISF